VKATALLSPARSGGGNWGGLVLTTPSLGLRIYQRDELLGQWGHMAPKLGPRVTEDKMTYASNRRGSKVAHIDVLASGRINSLPPPARRLAALGGGERSIREDVGMGAVPLGRIEARKKGVRIRVR